MSDAIRLQNEALGSQVSFTWFGIRKTAQEAHRSEAAQVFSASTQQLSLSKSLLNTKNKFYKTLTALRNDIRKFWYGISLPWVESGIRLLKKKDVEFFNTLFLEKKTALTEAAFLFAENFYEIKEEARALNGRLYLEADYPETAENLFKVELSWPNLEAPEGLKLTDPQIYAEEAEKVRKRFETAVELAESAFAQKFEKLLENFLERLKPGEDGKPKRFHTASIENLKTFCDTFRHLNVRSDSQLEALINQMDVAVGNGDPELFRMDQGFRDEVQKQLEEIQEKLLVNIKPLQRRNLILDDEEE